MNLNDIIDINLLGRFWTNVKTYFNELFSSKEDKATIANHGTSNTTFALTPNVLHVWGTINSLTLSLVTDSDNYVDGYWFKFTAGSSFSSLTMPSGVNWVVEPDIEAGKTYEVMIVDGLASYVTDGIGDSVKAKTRLVNHGTSDTTYQLAPNEFHIWGEVASLNLTLKSESDGYVNGYWFRFTSGNTATILNLPNTISWYQEDGFTPEANHTYEVTIVEGYACFTDYADATTVATKNWVQRNYQQVLESGTSIKTINNVSILGNGNINVDNSIDIVASSGTTLNANVNKIYTYNSTVTTLAVTLPAIIDNTKAQSLSVILTTGSSPNVSFSSAGNTTVLYYDGYELEDGTMYEINALYTGIAWIIGASKIATN